MITRTGFVLCEISGEYDDVCVTPLAYSDNILELEQEITRLNAETQIKIDFYNQYEDQANQVIIDFNTRLFEALIGYESDLNIQLELPRPEKWPPTTGQEHKEWEVIKERNYQIRLSNITLRSNRDSEIVNSFIENNEIPLILKSLISKYYSKFELNKKPQFADFDIRPLEKG